MWARFPTEWYAIVAKYPKSWKGHGYRLYKMALWAVFEIPNIRCKYVLFLSYL